MTGRNLLNLLCSISFLCAIGKGVMYMGSSGKYEGEFFEGEITGTGVRSYGDGSVYSGRQEKKSHHIFNILDCFSHF